MADEKVDNKIKTHGGKREGSGRKAGVPNKVTADVRNALLEALNAGDGAVAYFNKQKEENPNSFNGLIAKVIPKEIISHIDINNLDDADKILKSAGLLT